MKFAVLIILPLLLAPPAFAYITYEETIMAAEESQEVTDVLSSIEDQYGLVCDSDNLEPARGGDAVYKVLVATCNVDPVPEFQPAAKVIFVYLEGQIRNGRYQLAKVRLTRHDDNGNWVESTVEVTPTE